MCEIVADIRELLLPINAWLNKLFYKQSNYQAEVTYNSCAAFPSSYATMTLAHCRCCCGFPVLFCIWSPSLSLSHPHGIHDIPAFLLVPVLYPSPSPLLSCTVPPSPAARPAAAPAVGVQGLPICKPRMAVTASPSLSVLMRVPPSSQTQIDIQVESGRT